MFRFQSGTVSISIRRFLMFIAMLIYCQPEYLKSIPLMGRIYRVLAFIGIMFVTFSYISKKRFPKFFVWLVLLYNSWITFLTIQNNGDIEGAIFQLLLFTGFVAMIDIFSENVQEFIESLLFIFEMFVYLNFVTVLFFPHGFFHRVNDAYGITKEWFLGANNNFLFSLFPATLIALLYKNLGGSKFRAYSLISIILATQLIRGSGTAKVGIVALILFDLVPLVKYILTPFKGLIVSFTLSFLIVITGKVEFLRGFVEGILGKDLTFTSRTFIWNNAISAIQEKPLGYGMMRLSDIVYILGNFPGWIWKGATHAHNNFLQVLFQGGDIGFSIYFLIILKGAMICRKYWNNRNARLLFYGLFIFTIMSITESLETQMMYLVIVLPFLLPNILLKEGERNE